MIDEQFHRRQQHAKGFEAPRRSVDSTATPPQQPGLSAVVQEEALSRENPPKIPSSCGQMRDFRQR